MLLVGLTGSVGMGKSTVSRMFRDLGVSIFDADRCVKNLYLYNKKLIKEIELTFPKVTENGILSKKKLSSIVYSENAFQKLERIVHPFVIDEKKLFIEKKERDGHRIVILDIPLLFEANLDTMVDIVVVVSASQETQYRRVSRRPGMTDEKFKKILARQLSDKDKKARADYVFATDASLKDSFEAVRRFHKNLLKIEQERAL